MGRLRNVHNELRGGLGPDEVVRVDCGAVEIWPWSVPINITAKIEPVISSCIKVAFTSLGLRVSGRRTHPLLPVEDISGSSGAGSGLTDASKVKKRIEKSRRLRPVVGLRPSPGRQSWSSPVAGGPEEYALQLALRPKATGETKNGKIAKRLARRRGHAKTLQ